MQNRSSYLSSLFSSGALLPFDVTVLSWVTLEEEIKSISEFFLKHHLFLFCKIVHCSSTKITWIKWWRVWGKSSIFETHRFLEKMRVIVSQVWKGHGDEWWLIRVHAEAMKNFLSLCWQLHWCTSPNMLMPLPELCNRFPCNQVHI